MVYESDDPRAKELHRAVLEHLIVDVKPFSTVEGRGFVKMQNTFHRNFKLGSSKFYREKMVKVMISQDLRWPASLSTFLL